VSVRSKLSLGTLLVSLGCLVSGCGGFSGSRSVSPATFLVPGLMHVEPAKTPPATSTLPAQMAGLPVNFPRLN
jgi:hypothetical protein